MLDHVIQFGNPEFWAAYTIAFIGLWRVTAGFIAHKWPYEKTSSKHKQGDPDWQAGYLSGFFGLLVWPLVIVVAATYGLFIYWPKHLTTPVERAAIIKREKQAHAAHMLQLAEQSKQKELEHGITGTSHLDLEIAIHDNDIQYGEVIQ
jgi:hypothetical protein